MGNEPSYANVCFAERHDERQLSEALRHVPPFDEQKFVAAVAQAEKDRVAASEQFRDPVVISSQRF